MRNRPGVSDTSTLLQCERFDIIPWVDDVGVQPVRLVLLNPVIREVDRKKYAPRNQRLAKRAVTERRIIFDRLPTLSDLYGLDLPQASRAFCRSSTRDGRLVDPIGLACEGSEHRKPVGTIAPRASIATGFRRSTPRRYRQAT